MTPFDIPYWFVLVFLFLIGATLGSFLNVCIYRIPAAEQRWFDLKYRPGQPRMRAWASCLWAQLAGLYSPPSHCPNCKSRIQTGDNVPIVGWLRLGGRCRNCRMRISPRYPLIELLNALLFVGMYWYSIPAERFARIDATPFFNPAWSDAGVSFSSQVTILHLRYAYHMVLIEFLVVATFIDFDFRLIPDGTTVPGMVIGLVGAAAAGRLWIVPVWVQDRSLAWTWKTVAPEWMQRLMIDSTVPDWIVGSPHLHGFAVSAAGLIVGGGTTWLVRAIGQWTLKREAMGLGDVTLMAMIGSFIGWQPVLIVFFVAPGCALVFVVISWLFRRDREIPYGPYLSLATLLVLVFWQRVWDVAERIFSTGPVAPLFFIASIVTLAGFLQISQIVKRLLGIEEPSAEPDWQWTAADQTLHLAGENADPSQGRWRNADGANWPGSASGRGQIHEQRWRGR